MRGPETGCQSLDELDLDPTRSRAGTDPPNEKEVPMKQVEDLRRLQKDLEAKGVKYCIGAYVDIHGVPKAKVVPIAHMLHMAEGSERYTGYALDGLGQAPNDDELTSVPDFSRTIQLPWEPKIAWIPSDNHFQGKPYAVPMDVSNHFLYYRSDYLNRLLTDSAWQRQYSEVAQRELGKALSPKKPEDWSPDDFVAAALFFTKTINPDSPTAFGTVLQAKNLIYNVMIWDNFLYGLGGSWFRSGFQPALNTPQAQKALDVYVTIMQKKATPAGSTSYEYGEANEAFRTGKVAFMVQWSAAFHELDDKTKSPMVAGNVKLAPVPGKKTHVHALGVGISAYSNTKPAVQKWVRFLATTQAMRMYADAGGIPPVRAALANPALAKQRPEFPLIAEHVEKYGYVETTIAETVPILEILAKHLSAAWALQVAPKIALDQANGEITQLLKEKGYLK